MYSCTQADINHRHSLPFKYANDLDWLMRLNTVSSVNVVFVGVSKPISLWDAERRIRKHSMTWWKPRMLTMGYGFWTTKGDLSGIRLQTQSRPEVTQSVLHSSSHASAMHNLRAPAYLSLVIRCYYAPMTSFIRYNLLLLSALFFLRSKLRHESKV